MSARTLHVAHEDEVAQVWPAVRAAHLFGSRERFERFYAEAPWRVRVTGRGEAVVLERWRTHLDVLALRGLWCCGERVPSLVREVGNVAVQQGFGRLLSPLVSEDVAADYARAGMERHCAVVLLRRDRSAGAPFRPPLPDGVSLRPAVPDDLGAVLSLDADCFDEFWRYDPDRIARYFIEDRIMVAEEAGQVIGYTLSTLLQDSGTVGRLAVSSAARQRGIGAALLGEAISGVERMGARSVSLCTQEENRASRELYRKMGLVEMSDRLVFLTSPVGADRR